MAVAGCTSTGRFYRAENMDEALDMLDGIVSELVEKQEERGSKGEIKNPRKDVAMVGGRRSLQSAIDVHLLSPDVDRSMAELEECRLEWTWIFNRDVSRWGSRF
jgi:hypothetical protein